MKKLKHKDKIPIKKLLNSIDECKQEILITIMEDFPNDWSYSKVYSKIELYSEIIKNNDFGFTELINEYENCNSVIRKLEIKYGKEILVEYKEKLKKRPKPKYCQSWDKKYWIYRKGLPEKEAEIEANKIKEKTKLNFIISENKYRPKSVDCKNSVDYWINLGYSFDEALVLREPFLSRNDLKSYIIKYGEDEGKIRYEKRVEKYKNSISKNKHLRNSGGYVSKESIRFFVPLYKFCRKLGIPKNHIYFGIKGSREFFIRDKNKEKNEGKFYDFTITYGINVVIEYNGTFWHPREKKEWRNPYFDYEEQLELEKYKKDLCESFGMKYYVIWDDDNKNKKMEFLKSVMLEKWRILNEISN